MVNFTFTYTINYFDFDYFLLFYYFFYFFIAALDRDLAGLLKPIITLRPPRVVFDDAAVKRTSHSSERTRNFLTFG
jgi:hypothetical protein